jgi:hypothetical protein
MRHPKRRYPHLTSTSAFLCESRVYVVKDIRPLHCQPSPSVPCTRLIKRIHRRNGQVRYELKTPWRNGTTHVIFEPLDIIYRMYGMPWAQGCAGTAISRLVSLDCRDAGGRATQEQLPRYPNQELISPVFMAYSPRTASTGHW